ncbi:MAG: phage tail tape measure protein, partial [Oscillospiraceae bacterium]|nr:phage tail tape measure protein [Oscillospiraceae bacterium]
MIAITDGDVVYKVRADNSGLEKDIKSAENMLISAADTVESAIIGSAKALGTGALAIAAGTAAIGTAAVGTSDTLDKAVSKIISATGASADSAEKLDKVVKEIYSDNFGEDFDDIANSISKITQNLGEMDEVSLVNITESAYALQDVFEYGVDESSRAAKAMAENFGISAERAYDYIARGAQNGLDYSGELLDSISEYSVQFAKMGLDADDMFNIFQQGAESGAWNLDKIGDAVKEMSIRVIDGSDSTIAGFEKIGLNADEMAARFSMGGSVARAAFTETLKALSDMEDPLERDAAGVALLGTMWEDLGPEAVSALADISDEAYECAGAVDGIMDVSYSSLSDALDGLKRQAKMLTQPLGESLIPLVEGVIDKLSAIADEVIPQMVTAAEPLVGALLRMSEPISELISELLP